MNTEYTIWSDDEPIATTNSAETAESFSESGNRVTARVQG